MSGRKWLGALTLFLTLIGSSSYASGPFVESRALGIVMTRTQTSVMINGTPAISGTTVFRGDVLRTMNASTAVVELRSGARLAISENSEVALDLVDPAAGTDQVALHRGAIDLRNPSPQPDWVTVPGASVLVQGERGFPAVCRIAMVGQSSAIINDRGHVEIRGSGAPLILPMGQYATLEAGRQQGGSLEAGAVTAEIPRGNVQRTGQPTFIPLRLNDKVYLNDLVKTESLGRVRIQLTDGSLLNIGARSEMKIVVHNAQSRQTTIELNAGKLRSQVQKISKQEGSFEVKTQTAVIGVVGTHFLVAADAKRTRVWCFEGKVSVRNINLAIVGSVLLNAGEFTIIPLGMPPAAVTSVSPGEAHTQISQTDATVSVAGVGAAVTAFNIGMIGAGAGGAVLAGEAISRANNATSSLDQAGTTLSGATSTLNNATNSANSALSNANSANQGSGNASGLLSGILQSLVSPTYPCGCH